jgi:outer membrane protein assembly factor BamB
MSPAVEDPYIYYGASWPSNTVWKIDTDGNKLWMADDHVGGHLNGTPAIGLDGESSGSVYIGGNYVLDISKSNGHVNWNTSPTSYSDYIALGENSTVYSHQWNNTMFGLRDIGTAYSVAFTGVANEDCRSPAALYNLHDEGEIMVWGGRSGRIYAVKTDDWSYLWTLHMPGTRIDVTPCVDALNNLYFATTLYNKEYFFCVNGKTGQVLWETPTGRDQIWASGCGALSLDQKTYYVQTQGNAVPLESAHDELGQLFAISTSDGSVKWTFNTKQYGWDMHGNACMVDKAGKVYISANDIVYCIRDEGTSPSLVWSIQLESANVVPRSFSTDSRGALLIGSRIDGFQGVHAIYSGFEPEEPVIFSMLRNGAGNVEIAWESQYGATYRVEAAAGSAGYEPAALTWIPVEEHIPSGGFTTTWEDTSAPTMTWKFYRVITEDP